MLRYLFNKDNKNKILIDISVIFIISVILLSFFAHFVPFNMDEFCYYLPIAVRHSPLNTLNLFHERASRYDLAPFAGKFLPLRAYHYNGSFTCLLYYPLFRIWPSPHSARLLGLIMLIFQAFLLHKIFNTDIKINFLALIFFMPYAFAHIADTGPVSFQSASVFLILFLANKWSSLFQDSKKRSIALCMLAGIVIFLCIWIKPTYFFTLPALFILIIYVILKNRAGIFGSRRKIELFKIHVSVFLVCSIIPTFILLNSKDRTGHRYFEELLKTEAVKDIIASIPASNHFYEIFSFFTNPVLYTHRFFLVKDTITPLGVLFILTLVAFLVFGIMKLYLKDIKLSFPLVTLSLFFLTLALVIIHPKTWATHHAVIPFPFLILALFSVGKHIYRNRAALVLFALFLLVNSCLYLSIPGLSPHKYNHPSRLKINEMVNKYYSDDYAFIVIDWGFYYIKALYGTKNQCVIYIMPFNKAQYANILRVILAKIHRKPMFIGRIDSESDLSLIKKCFPDLTEMKTDFDTGKWRIWYDE